MAEQPTITLRGKAYGVVRKLGDAPSCRSFLVEADGRRHVLKVYRAPMAVAFDREAARLASLQAPTPGLILPEDTGPSGEERYLLRPWIDAAAFDAFARRFTFNPRKIDTVLALGQALCRAVAPLHAAGLGHGRLTNTNVFFSADGAPLVTDALIGPAVATPSPAGDVAQLGLLLCRILTRRPELTVNDRTLMEIHKARVPLSLIRVLWHAIQPRPEDRFADAATLATALAEVTAAEHLRTVYVRPTPLAAAPAMGEGVSPGVRNAALLVLALGLVSLGAWWWGAGKAPEPNDERPATSILAAVTTTKPAPAVAASPVPPTATPLPQADRFAPGSSAGERRVVQLSPGVEMAFRWITPGTFTMGSPASEEGREGDEVQHRVTLTRGFWMAETEVTCGQFSTFVSQTGHRTTAEREGLAWGLDTADGTWKEIKGLTWRSPGFAQSDAHPVVCVSWDDTVAYCRWLQQASGLSIALPTEAQWEYACRAGTTSRFAWGDELSGGLGWLNGCDTSADKILAPIGKSFANKFPFDDGYMYTAPVGSFQGNDWGLKDMHGNVWEWCLDWHGDYPSQGATDPTGTASGASRVFRGGSWSDGPANCRSATRHCYTPGHRGGSLGFRVVAVELPPTEAASAIAPRSSTPTTQPALTPAPGAGPSSTGTTAGERRVVQLSSGVEMAFRWITPGSFLMGSPASEEGREGDEVQHRVTLTRGFWMAETETTQAQWQAVMGDNPSSLKGATLPVEQVSWEDATAFCRKLSSSSGLRVSLPTEAQWEYACRAGTTTAYHSGSGEVALARAGWYKSNANGKSQPVGQKEANAAGLRDMHGNVWEWCGDWYGEYPAKGATDPTGPSSGAFRVHRGGSWGSSPARCRSAARARRTPDYRHVHIGFRVVAGPLSPAAMASHTIPPAPGEDKYLPFILDPASSQPFDSRFQRFDGYYRLSGSHTIYLGGIQKDCHIRVRLRELEGQDFGFILRSQSRNGYADYNKTPCFLLQRLGGANLHLFRYAPNPGRLWKYNGFPLKRNQWHTFDLYLKQKALSVYFDGKSLGGENEVLEPFMDGFVGLRTIGSTIDISMLEIRPIQAGTASESISTTPTPLSAPGTAVGEHRVVALAPGVEMAFRWIEPGSFLIGSPPQEPARDRNEGPQTRVAINNGYWIGETEVTVAAWDAFVKDTGFITEAEQSGSSIALDNGLVTKAGINWKSPGFAQEKTHPVVCVSREDIDHYCSWLKSKVQMTFLLPSEAEWEYACRAGTNSAWSWGNSPDVGAQYANLADKDFLGSRSSNEADKWNDVFGWSDGFVYTAPVRTFLPNSLGLHDMHGNVHELTRSDYGLYPGQSVNDGAWATAGPVQICRGGCWGSKIDYSRAASRSGGGITPSSNVLGFRLISYDDPPAESSDVQP